MARDGQEFHGFYLNPLKEEHEFVVQELERWRKNEIRDMSSMIVKLLHEALTARKQNEEAQK